MPCYDVANLVTVTQTSMIDKMPCGYETLTTTAVRIRYQVSHRAAQWSQWLTKSPADQCKGLSCFNSWLFHKSNIRASWIHLRNCRCCQEQLKMLLQSVTALGLVQGGSESIWMYVEELVRSTRVAGSLACGFWIDLHLANTALGDTSWRCFDNIRELAAVRLLWLCGMDSAAVDWDDLKPCPYNYLKERNHGQQRE